MGTVPVDIGRTMNVHPEGVSQPGKDKTPVKRNREEKDDGNNQNEGGEKADEGPPVFPVREKIHPRSLFTEEFPNGRHMESALPFVPVVGFLENVFQECHFSAHLASKRPNPSPNSAGEGLISRPSNQPPSGLKWKFWNPLKVCWA